MSYRPCAWYECLTCDSREDCDAEIESERIYYEKTHKLVEFENNEIVYFCNRRPEKEGWYDCVGSWWKDGIMIEDESAVKAFFNGIDFVHEKDGAYFHASRWLREFIDTKTIEIAP